MCAYIKYVPGVFDVRARARHTETNMGRTLVIPHLACMHIFQSFCVCIDVNTLLLFVFSLCWHGWSLAARFNPMETNKLEKGEMAQSFEAGRVKGGVYTVQRMFVVFAPLDSFHVIRMLFVLSII